MTYFWNTTQVFFFHFSFYATLFFPLTNAHVYVNIDQGIHWGKNKVAQNKKRKKTSWVFVFQKYGKFWSVSLGHFIQHKPLISEECISTNELLKEFFFEKNCKTWIMNLYLYNTMKARKINLQIVWTEALKWPAL